MKKLILAIICLFIVFSVSYGYSGCQGGVDPDDLAKDCFDHAEGDYQENSGITTANVADDPSLEYKKGVNDALQAIILLSLELDLKNERKTWGEMADIVRDRLNVKSTEEIKP